MHIERAARRRQATLRAAVGVAQTFRIQMERRPPQQRPLPRRELAGARGANPPARQRPPQQTLVVKRHPLLAKSHIQVRETVVPARAATDHSMRRPHMKEEAPFGVRERARFFEQGKFRRRRQGALHRIPGRFDIQAPARTRLQGPAVPFGDYGAKFAPPRRRHRVKGVERIVQEHEPVRWRVQRRQRKPLETQHEIGWPVHRQAVETIGVAQEAARHVVVERELGGAVLHGNGPVAAAHPARRFQKPVQRQLVGGNEHVLAAGRRSHRLELGHHGAFHRGRFRVGAGGAHRPAGSAKEGRGGDGQAAHQTAGAARSNRLGGTGEQQREEGEHHPDEIHGLESVREFRRLVTHGESPNEAGRR